MSNKVINVKKISNSSVVIPEHNTKCFSSSEVILWSALFPWHLIASNKSRSSTTHDSVGECKCKEPSEGIVTSHSRMFTSCSESVRRAGRVIPSACSASLRGLGICGQTEAVQAVLWVSGEWSVSRCLSGLSECCTRKHSTGSLLCCLPGRLAAIVTLQDSLYFIFFSLYCIGEVLSVCISREDV